MENIQKVSLVEGLDYCVPVGFVLPFSPEDPGVTLVQSNLSLQRYPEAEREAISSIMTARPWSEFQALATEHGGDEEDIQLLIDSGYLLRLRSPITVESFFSLFEGKTIVSLNACRTAVRDDDRVCLVADGSSDTVVVSSELFELIKLSSGDWSLPNIIDAAFQDQQDLKSVCIRELLEALPDLLRFEICALVRASTDYSGVGQPEDDDESIDGVTHG